MNRSILEVANGNEEPIFVQIDPWADFLYLENGESIKLAAYSEQNQDVIFELSEYENTRTIFLLNNTEYFFLEGTKEINRADYGSNIEGWSQPLNPNSSLKSRIKLGQNNET